MMIASVDAGPLRVSFEEHGPRDGWPVVLLHGFPYDVRAYNDVAAILAAHGARAMVPYLRGYGPTRFRSKSTPRSGQQAALGADLLALLDALAIPTAFLAGYDWGGRAACIVAALYPERARGLVSCKGYNVQNIASALEPHDPESEWRLWYQYYFHSERGRSGLARDRRAVCRLLWKSWSPDWQFDDATFERTAAAFDNPDFVDVVIHSYRHRFGLVPGDPDVEPLERRLAAQPTIAVPAIVLDGATDGVSPHSSAPQAVKFAGPYELRTIPRVGHNVPQEAPDAFAEAVLDLRRRDEGARK